VTDVVAWQGDITRLPSDVIVNAANSSLLGGGGVDGAIHRAAGPELLAECRTLGGAKTGEAKMTDAYGITSAKKIVHAVGPVYRSQSPSESARLLASCYSTSLDLADGGGFTSIAFPSISTGVYGYPISEAEDVAVEAIRGWLSRHPDTSIATITLVAFSERDFAVIERALLQ
jgi:O-acetyl-ADP-ribose deacetylase (regulator of RNase III)